MDLISELGFLISKDPTSDINTYLPVDSKLCQLYLLIINKKVSSDQEAAMLIYNSHKADKRYLMLKRNLIKKLYDLVFYNAYDTNKKNYTNLESIAFKELNIAKKLLSLNVYHNPSKIVTKLEHMAEKMDMTEIQLQASIIQRSIYALKGYPNKTIAYDKKIKQLQKLQKFINEAKGMIEILYATIKYTCAQTNTIINLCNDNLQNIERWQILVSNPLIDLYYTQISIIKYKTANHFTPLQEAIASLKTLWDKYPILQDNKLNLQINYEYAYLYLCIKQNSKAINYINKALMLSHDKAFDKFKVQELNFDILLKKGDYNQALFLIRQVNETDQFAFLNQKDKELWLIREAFLFISLYYQGEKDKIQQLPNYISEQHLRDFNDHMQELKKDKFGYNITIRFIRLFIIKETNNERLEQEGCSLQAYYHRYIKYTLSQRSICFYKYISKAAVENFNGENMERLMLNYQKQLDKCSPNYEPLEIIPYDKLWRMMLK